jgi:predicted phage-related endonuclease
MLTPEQLAERKKGIGASDAAKIVSGDWFALWQNKTGAVPDEDLSDVFAVQLGVVTEELNLNWGERRTGAVIAHRGKAVVSKKHPFLRCTLDGFDVENKTVWQAKHVNGFSKIDEIRAKYVPQVTHEMIVTGCRKAILSVIIGTTEPVFEMVDLDTAFASQYIEQARDFWGYVERNEPPPQVGALATPAPPTVMRVVDMSGSNAWGSAAADWLSTKDHAKTFDKSVKDLKSMVEPDVREATGFGIIASRNKAGSISIKVKEK